MLLTLRCRALAWRWPFRLLGVAGLLALAGLARVALLGLQAGEGYPLFLPAVVAAGFLFGLPGGLLAVLGGWLVGTYFFTEPPFSFVIDDPFDLTSAVLFPLLSLLLLVFIELLVSIRVSAAQHRPPG